MNYNIGDVIFTTGKYKGISIKEIAQTDFNYLTHYLTFHSDYPEYRAVEAISKGYTWIDKAIVISDELFLNAMRFAGVVEPTVGHYPNLDKIERDITDGRIGEWIAYYVFSDIYGDVTPPDEKVYKTNKKWKPNLICLTTEQTFSVHSQNIKSAEGYVESWIFSTRDPEYLGSCDPKTKECFVLVDISERIAKVRSIINLGTIHEKKLWCNPMNPAYYTKKQCVKYEDLEKIDRCEI